MNKIASISGKIAAVMIATGCATLALAAPTAGPLCVGQACLGMSVEDISKLPLEPAGTFKNTLRKGTGQFYGLDANGERLSFSLGDLDRQAAAQFAQKLKTICAAEFVSAKLKASDGQLIRLTLRPVLENGTGRLVVTEIARPLPPNLSQSDVKSFEDQARERYGDAYSPEWHTVVKKPTAALHFDLGMGRALKLRLPVDNVRSTLMEQPGCSSGARLD